MLGAAGEGRVSAATRADYAAAAAAVLTTEGHAGKTYELGGDTAITLAEYAAEIARRAGKAVVYKNLSETEYTQALVGFGRAGRVRGDLRRATRRSRAAN